MTAASMLVSNLSSVLGPHLPVNSSAAVGGEGKVRATSLTAVQLLSRRAAASCCFLLRGKGLLSARPHRDKSSDTEF